MAPWLKRARHDLVKLDARDAAAVDTRPSRRRINRRRAVGAFYKCVESASQPSAYHPLLLSRSAERAKMLRRFHIVRRDAPPFVTSSGAPLVAASLAVPATCGEPTRSRNSSASRR